VDGWALPGISELNTPRLQYSDSSNIAFQDLPYLFHNIEVVLVAPDLVRVPRSRSMFGRLIFDTVPGRGDKSTIWSER